MAYPTVRYFPPHPQPNDFGVDFLRSFNVQEMKDFLIEKLQETQTSNATESFLCDIQPYEKVSIVSDSNYLLTYVIIDEPDNKIAQELVIDYCPVKKIKLIYSLNNNTALVELLKPNIYPSLFRVQSDKFIFLAGGNNKTHFTETINADLESIHMTPFNIIDMTTKLYNLLFQKNQGLVNDFNTVYLSDLEATLKYSLEHEIVSRSVISGDALEALKTYLELLIECFPSSLRGKKFIKLVMEHTTNNDSISGEELGSFISRYELLLKPYVTKNIWIGCEGSHPMYRKYPCGLWTLFHTLTVQASTKNLTTFSGPQVLEAIAGYVKHFFGCTDCSEHFMNMATSIKSNVSSLDDAVLWLWSAHNQVNQRLAGDVTEDPMHPKIIFPLKSHCENCHLQGTDEWNKTAVIKYLKNMYSSISLKQMPNDDTHPQVQNLVISQHIVDDNLNTFDEEEWKIDVSTCMISYLLSCSVLMVLFYLLVVRNRCKRNKYIYFILGKV